ncbi:LysR family transcriptional regulator [Bordetella genomosp. 9]|uniref:LysR family transcriptional regulator n=1 Tax=Bordetella genomosp. 9 TaxID=1416803 RepID=A0A1W6Z1X6_9BORD|nr:LysR family transcriptional regulator [Bordetella genomosp. 9]ARP87365.1 LysR family transcriptional regulator [Bordetella genomosp. 9]ARP91348.1 LysR family transcriptional regulator [Bordetella genomosp. 9]
MLKLDFDERNLRSLRVFCHVAEAGGFAAAERRLLMSKASISRHIRDVEAHLGVRLCERGPGGFRLTAEGVVALRLATTALRALARIRPEVDAAHGVLSGPLAIGLGEHTLTHPECHLPEALGELHRQAPNVQPEILVMSFKELDHALHTQRIDIAIRGKYSEDRDFNYLPLYRETHRVYVSRRISAAREQARLPLVYRSHPHVERALATGRYERGPEVGGLDAVGAMVATGYYQGLLPSHYGELLQGRFGLQPAARGVRYSHIGCAVTLASRQLSHRAELMLNILRDLHRVPRRVTAQGRSAG